MKKMMASILILILSLGVFGVSAFETDELPTNGWTFSASSINANNGVQYEVPEKVIDGDLKSHWHSMINPKDDLPISFTVILPTAQYVSGYRYYPRADGGAGICTKYEIYVSDNEKDFTLVSAGEWGSDTKAKTEIFGANIKAKAVKLVILEATWNYASAGEIRLIAPKSGYENLSVNEIEEKLLKPTIFDGLVVRCSGKSAQDISRLADGNSDSYWHSEIKEGRMPYDITYDFRAAYTIKGLRYFPRRDGNLTGHFTEFSVYSSDDAENYELVKSFTCDEITESPKDFMFDFEIKTRYLKITLTQGLYGYGTCAEIYFLQTQKQYEEDLLYNELTYTLKIGSEEVKVKRNLETTTLKLDAAPFISGGSTMIPLRGILEDMGMTVEWNGTNQEIWVFDNTIDMIMRVEDDRVYIGDVRYNASAPPTIKNSRTYIPLRFMSEQLGYNVYWDGEKQEITISTQ